VALSLAALAPVAGLLSLRPAAQSAAQQLGLAPSCYAAALPAVAPLLLVAVLFAGPLLQAALGALAACCAQQRRGSARGAPPQEGWLDAALPQLAALPPLRLARALVAAPVLEEWVFRACAAPLWRAAGASHAAAVAAAAACFGAVHAHHYWELLRSGTPPAAAARAVALQVAYTAAFAAIAAHAFQRTGSLAGVVAAHALANALGLPSLGWLSAGHPLHAARGALGAAYAGGIAGFAWLLAGGAPALWAGAACALYPGA
jgi:membrane protease YdiL (CAAX protease family)